MKTNVRAALGILCVVLGGCSLWSDPRVTVRVAPPAPPRAWVVEIRAAAATAPSIVEVTPLMDRSVLDLREQAKAAELKRDFTGADGHLAAAIAVREDDPDLWQWRAEIALERREWRDAATLAQHSLDLGPRIGTLCVRNWLTLEAARTELGDKANAESARAQVKSCEVPELIRM